MITKGELIACSQPFVFALLSEEKDKRCDHCFKLLESKLGCSKCNFVKYCNRQCQRESSAMQLHSHECAILADRPLTNLTRLIARLFKVLEQNECHVEVIGTYQRDWKCLMDHYEEIVTDIGAMFQFDKVLNELELIFDDKLPDIRVILRLYGKILVNSFAVQDEKMQQIGRALYLGPSIFDHSCNPSASFMFIGTTIYIKAIKDIPTNDVRDVRISYIDELESTSERQKQLQSHYYFECDCERCNSEMSSVIDMSEDDRLRPLCDKLEGVSSNDSERFYRFQFSGRFANSIQHERCQIENKQLIQLVLQLRDEVMSLRSVLAVKIADFIAIYDKDIDLSLRIIDVYRSYYGRNHPRVALRLFIAAKNADKYPILKRRLLMEARSIALLITPSALQIENYKNTRQEESRSRSSYKPYTRQGSIFSLASFTTLATLIENELSESPKQNYSKDNFNNHDTYKIVSHKQRSRSGIRDYGKSRKISAKIR